MNDTLCGIMLFAAGPDKSLRKMRENPSGWRIEDLLTVARVNGLDWRRPVSGGSHVVFSAFGVREIVTVPAKRPIKPIYTKHFVALIDVAKGGEN